MDPSILLTSIAVAAWWLIWFFAKLLVSWQNQYPVFVPRAEDRFTDILSKFAIVDDNLLDSAPIDHIVLRQWLLHYPTLLKRLRLDSINSYICTKVAVLLKSHECVSLKCALSKFQSGMNKLPDPKS